jgi:hypothetical protein
MFPTKSGDVGFETSNTTNALLVLALVTYAYLPDTATAVATPRLVEILPTTVGAAGLETFTITNPPA